jgi:hypothetical protein
VLVQGRSFPVTVIALSDAGLVAEGSDLAGVLGGFMLEIALESSGDTAWNPKAAGPEFLHLFSAGAERESDTPSGRLRARFTEMSEPARRLLRDYLCQLGRGRAGRSVGGALSRPPEGLADRA